MAKYVFRNTLPFYPMRSLSHLFIVISVIVSLIGFTFPMFVQLFGFHRIPLGADTWYFLLGQLILYQFLHGNFLHLLMNSFFLYQAGPEVETRMSRSRFLAFFVTNTLFVAVALWFLSPFSLTIGISGFCMALLAYLWIDLSTTRHPLAPQILTMLLINIAFGLFGGISFVGHLFGAIWGVVWWFVRRR